MISVTNNVVNIVELMLRYHVPYKEDSWDPARSSPGFILIQKNIYKYVDVLAVSCREIKSPQSEANPYS